MKRKAHFQQTLASRASFEKFGRKSKWDGADRPFSTSCEVWFSQKIMAEARQGISDPHSGATPVELLEYEPVEPDPALFQVPWGYTVKDPFANRKN